MDNVIICTLFVKENGSSHPALTASVNLPVACSQLLCGRNPNCCGDTIGFPSCAYLVLRYRSRVAIIFSNSLATAGSLVMGLNDLAWEKSDLDGFFNTTVRPCFHAYGKEPKAIDALNIAVLTRGFDSIVILRQWLECRRAQALIKVPFSAKHELFL